MIITVKDALVILVRLYIFTKIMDRNGNLIRKSWYYEVNIQRGKKYLLLFIC